MRKVTIWKRNCPNCSLEIKYSSQRAYRLGQKQNTSCMKCRSNNGNFSYNCHCGHTIYYKRKSDYKKAIKNNINCQNCNKQKYVLRNRKNVLKAKSKWNKKNKQYYKNKRINDLNYRIASSIRVRTLIALKRNWKSGHTIELLGCSIKELIKYLESKFNTHMTWKNYAKYWEIDHIIPCASFDLSKDSTQKKCFNYTNLQPLEKDLNRRKGYRL